ncbi:MAG TPA: hypothetical protein VH700_08685 [Gemmatimonadales bacterium]
MQPGTRYSSILPLLLLASATPALAQNATIGKNQFAFDVGMLQGGLSYARRVGPKLSIGGGLWGAWEPWNSFESSFVEPLGVELFVRVHPAREVHLEAGPSLLRYGWADDCSECTGTFTGLRAAAMVGTGIFSLGPAVRYGRITGGTSGSEMGVIWGIQARLLFAWGE